MSGHDLDYAPPAVIPTMSVAAIDRVRRLEAVLLQAVQTPLVTRHVLHAGMYARTIRLQAEGVLTGALIKRATMLIVSGHCRVSTEDGWRDLDGYHVIPASAGRKQAFLAYRDTDITMLFPTAARTVEDAEREFTDESDRLLSRHGENEVVITGE